MTGAPLHLPLDAGEAAALAELIFDRAAGRPLTTELRARLDGIARGLRWSSLRAWLGSLARDPVHESAFYVAVDALGEGVAAPLLLRLATASAPSSGLFPNATLIARARLADGREVVISAAPFGEADTEAIRTFVERVDPGFAARPGEERPAGSAWAAIRAGARVRR